MSSSYKNFNHKQLDPLLHNRLRLAVLSAVAHSEEVDFMSLRHAVQTTDGNLSIQLKKLEEAGLVAIKRSYQISRKQTNVALTTKGLHALQEYRKQIQNWLDL